VVRLIILGGPGSGKGTQAEALHKHLGIPWIATGEVLRQAIAHQTELGLKAKPYLEAGELVPDNLMIAFIRDRLLEPDAAQGWILDGYPRTAFQAEELNFLLDELQQKLDWAIWLEVPVPVLKKRSIARSRVDDDPSVVERRIELYQERTVPILDYYDYRKLLLRINGDQSIDKVQQDILTALN